MATPVGREEVQRLVAAGARLVDVLARDEYEQEHLPGALNIPLRELDERAPRELLRDEPVIVYCHDYQ